MINCRGSIRAALFLLLSGVNSLSAQPMFLPGHKASHLDDWEFRELNDRTCSFEVKKPGTRVLVIRSSDPLSVAETSRCHAELLPGWDGTAEYSHYRLVVSATEMGQSTVQIEWEQSPSEPQLTTLEEQRRFFEVFRQRESRPPETAESIRKWQNTYRERLIHALMGGPLPSRIDPDARILESIEYPEFTLQRVEYSTMPNRRNVLLLSIPRRSIAGEASTDRSSDSGPNQPQSGSGDIPLLVALHGHEAGWGQADQNAFTEGHADDFMAYFAKQGWAVLQPATMNHTLQHSTWTLQGEWTWDSMVAIDYALTEPSISRERVAVCGLSTGGHLAMNLLAIDERVKAGVVGCVLSTWNHYECRFRIPPHCDCGIHHQLSSVLEPCDWAALAAPKPVLFQHGRQDAAFCPGADAALLNLKWNKGVLPMNEFQDMFQELERVWGRLDSLQSVRLKVHDGAHRIDNEAAMKWLNESPPFRMQK
jgi:dienelactone hydrolase